MFTEKDILTRLRNGEDAQKIADEMANILNAANKTYTDEKEAEKEKAKAEAAAKIQKEKRKKEADVLMDAIGKFAVKYADPAEQKATKLVFAELDGSVLIEIIDTFTEFKDIFEKIESIFDVKPTGKKKADDVFADLFNKMGW